MNILNSTLLILINKTTANVSNKVPGLEFFRLTAINTHNWSMDILRKFKVVDQLYICVCFTWIIRFMGPALYFCFIKKSFVSSLYLVHIYSVYINFVALSILQNGKLPRFFDEDLQNNLFSDLPAESSCLTNLRAGLDSLGLYKVQYMYWYIYYMYLQLKFNVCNNNKQISQFDSQLTNLKKILFEGDPSIWLCLILIFMRRQNRIILQFLKVHYITWFLSDANTVNF